MGVKEGEGFMKNVHVKEVELKGKEWETVLDNAFKKRVKGQTIDGFRKGKCPKDVYLKKFGIESLFMDAIDEACGAAYMEMLKGSDLAPVCEPKMDVKEIDKDHVKFEFTVITKPEVKLGKYKDLGVKKDKVKVTKDEIESEVAKLCSRFAEIVIKEEGKVEEGNTAVIDFEGFVDGKALDGGNGANYPLEIGSHTFIPGFEDQVIGMKIDETKEINVKTIAFGHKDSLAKDLADIFIEADIFDYNLLLSECKKNKVNGIIASSEITTEVTAIIADKLGLPGNDVKNGFSARNKYIMREKVSVLNSIKQPKYSIHKENAF